MKQKIELIATLTCAIKKDGDSYITSCPILDLFSQGDSEEEAKKNLRDTLHLFFAICSEKGTLFKVLEDCGLSYSVKERTKKIISSNDLSDYTNTYEEITGNILCPA